MEEQANTPASTEPTTQQISVLPTKDLFIDMLVRDISITEAVLDLIDNSVDGAKRVRDSTDFEGFQISITANEEEFVIEDNCGGIPRSEAARAFRFGPIEAEDREVIIDEGVGRDRTLGLIGRYGIGMKRAIFKLGRRFTVETSDGESHYQVAVNVDEWRKDNSAEAWNFPLEDLPLSNDGRVKIGTIITIGNLIKGVKDQFKLANVISALIRDIARRHENSLNNGLRISLNGIDLSYIAVNLLFSEQVHVAYEEHSLQTPNGSNVHVRIYAGLGNRSSTPDAGWYIYGNGRLILSADKSLTTGWGEREGTKIPQYHYQFSRFRGYVLFESQDAEGIPWDTTKTGINVDTPIYQFVRQRMITLMRDVIDTLNLLKEEKEGFGEQGQIAQAIKKAAIISLSVVPRQEDRFTIDVQPLAIPSPRTIRIAYKRTEDLVEKVRRRLAEQNPKETGERSPKEIGEATFDYYVEEECND